ncbi:MAG: hypothetical protein AB1523_14230 [Bacillota bacterium]
MPAMGVNTGGQVGYVLAASIMLAVLKAMGVIQEVLHDKRFPD